MAHKRNIPATHRRLSVTSAEISLQSSDSGLRDIATNLQSLSKEDVKAAEAYIKTVERMAHDEYINQIDEDEWTP